MDILNWIYLVKSKLVKTQLQSPDDLVVLGTDQGYEKRGDKYISYGMKVSDFAQALGGDTVAYYEMDMAGSKKITATTKKGIIKVLNMASLQPSPGLAFSGFEIFGIVTNSDSMSKCYVQFTTSYNTTFIKDQAAPVIIGVGLDLSNTYQAAIYDACPQQTGLNNQFKGDFYIYFEIIDLP